MRKRQNKTLKQEMYAIMFELVRAAALDRVPHISSDKNIEWELIFDQAREHGLIGWIWDGMKRLPQTQQPSRFQRIGWGLSAQEIETRYYHHKKVLREMIAICNQHNIRLLLLKGFCLSELYPKPECRPAGDIDIYLFDDFEKGNSLFSDGEIPYKFKHTAFDFQGAHIENHQMLVTPNSSIKRRIGAYLLDSMDSVKLTHEGYYTLPTIPNLVYLIMHALNHANYYPDEEFLNLKNLLDLAIYFKENQDQLLPTEVKVVMKSLHFERSFELIVYLSEWLLEIDLSQYHVGVMSRKDKESIYRLLVEEGMSLRISSDVVVGQAKAYWDRYLKLRRIYKYIPRKHENLHTITFHQIVSIKARSVLHLSEGETVRGIFKEKIGKKKTDSKKKQ